MALTDGQLMMFLQNSLNTGDLDAESGLFSTGVLDSVSMVNLIAFVEQTTGIQIRADDVTLENFDTPARILRFTEANI